MFESPGQLVLGLVSGICFGFLLQKGRAAKHSVIVGQFLLRDWTVVKIMVTAIGVGAIGVYTLVQSGQADLHVRPFLIGGVLVGALFFGIGLVVLGYCPGTSVAACGEGSRDAMVGVAGMLCGAAAFVALFPVLQPLVHGLGDVGKVTVPQLLGVSPWVIIVGVLVVIGALLAGIEYFERRKEQPPPRVPPEAITAAARGWRSQG